AIAKGIKPGVKVRQGQVIGFVGTTGLSTGPHLHYELIVNGNKVDALKIRLPGGKSLEGKALAQFETERKRIDDLLGHDEDQPEVAATRWRKRRGDRPRASFLHGWPISGGLADRRIARRDQQPVGTSRHLDDRAVRDLAG